MKKLLNKIRISAAILISKPVMYGLRLLGRGGTSLPGKIALKIYPDMLNALSGKFRIIMITGTNGKTTTSRIVAGMLEKSGMKYISNKSGANLASGLVTTLISAISLTGRPMVRTALLETDEAAFGKTAPRLKPEIVIVTNFFRDQLDRFGEIYTTLNRVREGILGTPESILILNADDSLCASLGQNVPNPVIYYGFAQGAYPEENVEDSSDAPFCINCSARYEYSSKTYGHLGHFSCPSCGYSRPEAKIECTQVLEYDSLSSAIEVKIPDGKLSARLALPGLYNIYNALAGTALGHHLGLSEADLAHVLEGFECGFGRMESVKVSDREIKMILVKNPTGFNQVLRYLLTQPNHCCAAFALNDKLADGTDVSWIWDVDFEILAFMQEKIRSFLVSGIRAEDMALRLKYAGIPESRIKIVHDAGKLIDEAIQAVEEKETVYLLPTYTAMLEIRKIMKERYRLKDFWK